ncbi:MAG: trehalose-6-phosphate synthase, partial [Syntrophothermus sp.]
MRLVVVSNRLPVTIEKKNKKLNIKESAGGLVSGLSSYLQSLHGPNLEPVSEYLWIGWPGLEVDEQYQSEIKERLLSQYNSFPIYLSEDVMENFYQGFCNKTIWPLFHYFPSFADYKEEYWNSYQQVNKQFFEQIIELLKPDDYLWIHDYHLMLLPKLIREKMPNIKIGFFLHIPFPTYEVYSLLPSKWRIEILEGLLGADVIGFHIHDYTQYFLRCVLRIIGLDSDLGRIYLKNRLINVNTFPMGIDYDKFQSALSSEGHKQEKIKLKQ